MSDKDVCYEVKAGVAWLTIDRPERRNALRGATVDGLRQGLERAHEDQAVRAVCITGAGDKAFCAGADLLAPASTGHSPIEGTRKYAQLLKQLAAFSKPLVARVAGHCVGGGMGLLLSCDLAYGAEDVRIGTPEVNVGLFPMMVAALLPLRGTGRMKVLEMVYTGALVRAPEAERLGLLTRAYPRAELDEAVESTLRAIVSKAPLAITTGKSALAAIKGQDLGPALDHLCGELDKLLATEDAAEGLQAFVQKRRPEWKGR